MKVHKWKIYIVNAFLFFLCFLSLASRAALAQDCFAENLNKDNGIMAFDVITCLETKGQAEKSETLDKLADELGLRWESGHYKSIEQAAGTLASLIRAYHPLENKSARDGMIKQFEKIVDRKNVSNWERFSAKTFIAFAWLDVNEGDALKKTLSEIIDLVVHIPVQSPTGENLQNIAKLAVLDLQKQAGLMDWHAETKEKFKSETR